jgi:hypothetical protein
MSTYATCVFVVGGDVDEVVGVLAEAGLVGLVGVDGDVVVVFAEVDVGDVEAPSAEVLSAGVGGVAVGLSVFDDVVTVLVYVDGVVVCAGAVADESCVFGEDVPPLDAGELVAGVGRGDAGVVAGAVEADVWALERAVLIAGGLDLPVWPVGWGFEHLRFDRGGFDGPRLVEVG